MLVTLVVSGFLYWITMIPMKNCLVIRCFNINHQIHQGFWGLSAGSDRGSASTMRIAPDLLGGAEPKRPHDGFMSTKLSKALALESTQSPLDSNSWDVGLITGQTLQGRSQLNAKSQNGSEWHFESSWRMS